MANILTTMRSLSTAWKQARMDSPSELDRLTSERTVLDWDALAKMISLSDERKKMYKDYDEMDEEITELASALDLYADFIVSGGSTSEDVYAIETGSSDVKVAMTIEGLEQRLNIKNRIWYMSRGVAKYGDAFYEVVINPNNVVKLVRLSPYTMFVNKDQQGNVDPLHPYVQKQKDTEIMIAEFEPWEIIHFKMGEGDYGVKNSVLNSNRRTYKIVRMLEDSVLVGRLTRAHQRLVYKIDVTNMGVAEAIKYIEKLKKMYRSRRYMDTSGRLRTELNLLQPQEDIWIPIRKERNAGVDVVAADPSVKSISDIEHFHNKMFAGTKAPKAYLGFERDVNAKATLTQQHLAFTKAVRRFRHVLAIGLRHLYKVEFIMQGVNPTSFEWKIKFPGLGAADDELKWDIENMKATMVKTYADAGVYLPPEWVIQHVFLDLTPSEHRELIKLMRKLAKPQTKTAPTPTPTDTDQPDKGNGQPPTDAEIENIIDLLKQDKELQEMSGRFAQILRTGENAEYY